MPTVKTGSGAVRPQAAVQSASDQVEILNPLEMPEWDAQLSRFTSAGFFHTTAWARVLVDTYGFKPRYFTVKAAALDPSVTAGQRQLVAALLPLMEVDSVLTGRRGVGLPFTDESAPLAADKGTITQLFEVAAEFGRTRGWKSMEIRGGHDCFPDAPVSTSFLEHRLNLEAPEAELFKRLESSARRAIRKAEQRGVTIDAFTTREAMVIYYSLHCQTRRRQGQPPQSWRFFDNIYRHVISAGHGRILLARHEGRHVAGAVFFHFARKVLYKFGASATEDQHLRGNDLLFWHAIRQFAQEEYKVLDFGRTSLSNAGLRQFKLKWGCAESPLSYLKYAPKERRWLTSPDKSSGLHQFAFRLLPTSISQLVGRWLYPHVA